MLTIMDGRPGDGKSYSAVALKILPHLARGGYVATNIEMVPEGVAAWILAKTGKIFNPERLRILTEEECFQFHKHIPPGNEDVQVLVVVDEAHLFFNARDWAKSDKDHRATFNLATQHRKYFLDIVLISQHFGNIDGQFLRLVEELWRFRDLGKWRFPFPGFQWIRLPFVRFLAIVFDRNGKTVLRRYWQPFEKLVGAAYNTRAVSKGSQMSGSVAKIELERDPVKTAKMARTRKIAGFVLLALALFLVGFVALTYGRISTAPEAEEFEKIKADNLKLKEKLAVKSTQPAQPEKAIASRLPDIPEPGKFPTWLDEKPKTDISKFSALVIHGARVRLAVKMDGATQWLERGGWCSRGRVMAIHEMTTGHLYDVEISDDTSIRHRLRLVRQDIPPEGATNPATMAPASGGKPLSEAPLGTQGGATFGGFAIQ